MSQTTNVVKGTPTQIASELLSLLPDIESIGNTYYKQEAMLALNVVLPAMFDKQLPITTKSVAHLLSNPSELLVLGQVLPDSSVKVNLLEYLERFASGKGGVDAKAMQGVLGGLTARLALSSYP